MENDNITLQWTYTLDGSPLDDVGVIFTSDSPSLSAQRVARYRSGGTTQLASNLQDRFVVSLTDSQSTITILRSQRSDSGTYELTVSPDDFAAITIKDGVKISVKCKYIVFPHFLLETSKIILIILLLLLLLLLVLIIIMNMRVMIFRLRGLVRPYSCQGYCMALSLFIKHVLSLLNYLFVSICLNQNEDLYICCHFSFELSIAKSARSYMFPDSTDIAFYNKVRI